MKGPRNVLAMKQAMRQKTPTLGLSLFVRDEEARVGDCLKSVSGIDEMKVLDTGSIDRTGDIVRECGGDFINGLYTWDDQNPDYGAARTASMRLCSTDWILCMGAGERLEEGCLEEIRRGLAIIETDHPEVEACAVLMKSGPDQFWSDRVFRNRKDIYFRSPIHEYCLVTNKAKLENVVINYKSRPKNLMPILENMCRENPDDMRNHYCMAREYFNAGYFPNSIYWFERYIRTRTMKGIVTGRSELADVYFTVGWAYAKMGELEEAKRNFVLCLSVNADFKEAALLMAQIALAQKDDPNSELNAGRWQHIYEESQNRNLGFLSKGTF